MTIILRRFSYNYISSNSFLLIIGMVQSGKSTLTKDILYYFQDIPVGSIITSISPDDYKYNKKYNYVPPIFIYDKYDKNIIKKFIKRQDSLIENDSFDTRAFIIFSNCFNGYNIKKDKYFKQISEMTKTHNYLCIYETDDLKNIYKDFISNLDFVFILKERLDINRKAIYNLFQKYLGIEYSLFNKLMDDYTENNNFLVLSLKVESPILEDKLFWFSSSLHNNFKTCSEESWIFNNNNYILQPPKRTINRNIFY